MKLGEVKIEALKIMFADYTDDLALDNLADLKTDENYGRYVNSMPGAINRCFSRLEDSNAVPVKKFVLTEDLGTISNNRIRFDLSAIISDFGNVDRIIYETATEYEGNCEYIMETNSIIVLPYRGGDYTIIYSPTLTRITAGTAEDTELELPDKIASIIPYLFNNGVLTIGGANHAYEMLAQGGISPGAKQDLFREDEPAEASEARNLFELSLEAANTEIKRRQTSVRAVFSQTEA